MERKEGSRIESVHRALVLLKLVIENGSLSVTEAAAALGVNASTAHRLLVTLAQDGFAVQRADRRYAVGPALPRAGVAGGTVITRMRPALERLFDRTGETVHLAILVGTRVQMLDGIEATSHALRLSSRVGEWMPAHLAASGKALLSDLSRDEVDARYTMALAGPGTRTEVIDLEALHEELDDVRESRISWNFGESEPGLATLATAVSVPDGPRAALVVGLPLARYTKASGEKWAEVLLELADELQEGAVRR